MILKRWSGSFYLFCAFTLAGTSVISARLVSGKLGTFTTTVVSLFFAILFLLPISWKKLMRDIRLLTRKDILFLSIQALFGMFLFRMFLLNALLNTSTGEAGILTGATPAITAILAMALLKEPVSGKKFIGILSTVGGVFLIQGLLTPGNSFSLAHMGGNVLVLCAAACESLFNIISRKFAVNRLRSVRTGEMIDKRPPLHPTVQTTIVSIIALFFCLIPALFEQPVPRLLNIRLCEWLALIWYGLFVTALAFVCWYSGIKRCSALTAAAFSGMMPFTSMLLSIVLLGETQGWQQWTGGILIIAGMILIGIGSVENQKTRVKNIPVNEMEKVME